MTDGMTANERRAEIARLQAELTADDAVNDELAGAPAAKSPNSWTVRNTVVAFGTIGALAVGCGALMTSGDDGPDDRDNPYYSPRQLAAIACENAVEERLKAPSTAEFTGQLVTGTGSLYTVTGTVDSENEFGAMLRNAYSCDVEFNDTEQYRVTVVDIG